MWQPHELGRDAACAVAQTSHIFLLTALNKQAAHKSKQSPLLKVFSEDHFLETTRIFQHLEEIMQTQFSSTFQRNE